MNDKRYGPWLSLADAIGVKLGFTASLTSIGSIREILGCDTAREM